MCRYDIKGMLLDKCVHVGSVINILISGTARCCLLLRTAGYRTTQNAKIKL